MGRAVDFRLTRDQELIRDTVHTFCETEMKPSARQIDKTGEYPRKLVHRLTHAVLPP